MLISPLSSPSGSFALYLMKLLSWFIFSTSSSFNLFFSSPTSSTLMPFYLSFFPVVLVGLTVEDPEPPSLIFQPLFDSSFNISTFTVEFEVVVVAIVWTGLIGMEVGICFEKIFTTIFGFSLPPTFDDTPPFLPLQTWAPFVEHLFVIKAPSWELELVGIWKMLLSKIHQ